VSTGRRVGRDFIITLAGSAMSGLQGIVVLPIMIRIAGEATYGAYVLLISFLGLWITFIGYGIPYRYQRNLVSAKTVAERRALFEPQFTFQLLMVGLISAAILLAGHRLETWLFGDMTHFTPAYLAAVLLSNLLCRQAQDYFRYTQRFLPLSISSAGATYVFVAILVAVAALTRELSLDTLLLLQTATYLAVSLPLLAVLLRELGLPRLRLPFRTLLEDLHIAWPLSVELLIDYALRFGDRYVILLYLSVADVGRYQPAYALATVVMVLPTLTDIILVPALSRLIDLGERAEAERLLAAFLRLFLMFALPFAVGALMMGPTILGLLASPEIGIASRWVAPLMAVASIFLGIMRLASLVAFVMGRTRTILGASLVGAGLNIALNVIVLAMIRDIAVPAASALVGYVAAAVYTVLALRPVWRIGFEWRAIARYCIAAAAMGIALRLLGYSPGTVEPVSPFVLAAVLPAGGIAYFAALAAIGGFGRREINQIGNLLRRGDNSAGQAA